jgi:hypothetical protein
MNDAYAVVERWAEAFNEGDAAAVAALYTADATIWGTLAQTLTTSPEAIVNYFTEAALAGLKGQAGRACLVANFCDQRHRYRSLRIHANRRRGRDLSGAPQFRAGET